MTILLKTLEIEFFKTKMKMVNNRTTTISVAEWVKQQHVATEGQGSSPADIGFVSDFSLLSPAANKSSSRI